MKKYEFSKVVLAAVMLTYFLGVALGVKVVIKNPEELGVYLAFIGAPVATALGFYYWKAKNENTIKIEKGVDGYGTGSEPLAPGGEEESGSPD